MNTCHDPHFQLTPGRVKVQLMSSHRSKRKSKAKRPVAWTGVMSSEWSREKEKREVEEKRKKKEAKEKAEAGGKDWLCVSFSFAFYTALPLWRSQSQGLLQFFGRWHEWPNIQQESRDAHVDSLVKSHPPYRHWSRLGHRTGYKQRRKRISKKKDTYSFFVPLVAYFAFSLALFISYYYSMLCDIQ